MYLRTLIGSLAGQILDFCPEAASAMLADGRAENPFPDVYVSAPPPAGEPAAAGAPDADDSAPDLQAEAAAPAEPSAAPAASRNTHPSRRNRRR